MNENTLAITISVTDSTFENDVLQSDIPVLVDFWAEWCGPCKTMGPTIDSLAVDYQGKLKVAKLNVDENPQAATQFGVRSIPTMIIFRDGQAQQSTVGARPKSQLQEFIDSNL